MMRELSKYFVALQHIIAFIEMQYKTPSKNVELLLSYAERLGSGAVFKRLGFLLERFAPDQTAAIARCRERMTKGNAKLDPSLPGEQLVTKWRLWVPASWKQEAAA